MQALDLGSVELRVVGIVVSRVRVPMCMAAREGCCGEGPAPELELGGISYYGVHGVGSVAAEMVKLPGWLNHTIG